MTYALFLCNRTMDACRPWLAAGIPCVTVDIREPDARHFLREHIRRRVEDFEPLGRPLFVAAFPPLSKLTVATCRRIAEETGAPYLIESPVGTWTGGGFIMPLMQTCMAAVFAANIRQSEGEGR